MNVSSDEAGARGWKLDVLDDEREIVIRRIVDQEAVVDVLLYAFGLVTGGNQWARSSAGSSVALFDTGVLVEFVVVRFHFVDDHSPFALDVDGTQRPNISGRTGTQVRLLFDFFQIVNRIFRVDDRVLVKSQHGLVVLIESVDNIFDRVLGIFQTPVLGRVLGASWDFRLVLGVGVTGLGITIRSWLVLSADQYSDTEKDLIKMRTTQLGNGAHDSNYNFFNEYLPPKGKVMA